MIAFSFSECITVHLYRINKYHLRAHGQHRARKHTRAQHTEKMSL
jgi:hypothetical protein